MNRTKLQSALRETNYFLRSPKYWATFATVVLLFAVTGPFGTVDTLPFLPRLAFWLAIHFGSWTIAIFFCIAADEFLVALTTNRVARFICGSLVASIPVGVFTLWFQRMWFGADVYAGGLIENILHALPLCGIFCVLCLLVMSSHPKMSRLQVPLSEGQPKDGSVSFSPETADTAQPAAQPRIMERLSLPERGILQHISVEDHYTVVKTSHGRKMLLMRFSDALQETGNVPGLQVHRSHWVADSYVESLHTEEGKLTVMTTDGEKIPVSRTFSSDARRRFGTPNRKSA